MSNQPNEEIEKEKNLSFDKNCEFSNKLLIIDEAVAFNHNQELFLKMADFFGTSNSRRYRNKKKKKKQKKNREMLHRMLILGDLEQLPPLDDQISSEQS